MRTLTMASQLRLMRVGMLSGSGKEFDKRYAKLALRHGSRVDMQRL